MDIYDPTFVTTDEPFASFALAPRHLESCTEGAAPGRGRAASRLMIGADHAAPSSYLSTIHGSRRSTGTSVPWTAQW